MPPPGPVTCTAGWSAASHEDLQRVLIEVSQIPGVARSTSVVALSRLVGHRPVQLLEAAELPPASRTAKAGQPSQPRSP